MWGDAKFRRLSAPPPNGRSLWLFLLTCEEASIIPGVIRGGEAALAEANGWEPKGFREAFGEVFREGLAKADWNARLVWLPKAIEHNAPQSPNVVTSWGKAFGELPDTPLKAEIYQAIKAFVEGLGEGFREAFGKAFGDICPNQDQEQEHKQEQKEQTSPSGAGDGLAAQVSEVFEYWAERRKAVLPKARAPKLDPKRAGKIRARLRDGYTVAELKQAVDGMLGSRFNVEGGHTDVELCCRDSAHVDRYMLGPRDSTPASNVRILQQAPVSGPAWKMGEVIG
jgi:hypothetical protein